jgi:periplasmic divalent cation tolerance protein
MTLPLEPAGATGPMRLVLTSFPSIADAERVSRVLVEGRWAACAQKLAMRSTYRWRGRIEEAEEVLVVYKTLPKLVGALFGRLAELHPYEVPEIVELDVPRVSAGYLAYLYEALGDPAPPLPREVPARAIRRSGSRRGRGARAPRGTRGRPRRR